MSLVNANHLVCDYADLSEMTSFEKWVNFSTNAVNLLSTFWIKWNKMIATKCQWKSFFKNYFVFCEVTILTGWRKICELESKFKDIMKSSERVLLDV